jgi:hypothetical protein
MQFILNKVYADGSFSRSAGPSDSVEEMRGKLAAIKAMRINSGFTVFYEDENSLCMEDADSGFTYVIDEVAE